MHSPQFEYKTSFIPVAYEREKRGLWIFQQDALPISPAPGSLYADPQYQAHLNDMGKEGWELVSVQDLLRGVYQYKEGSNKAFGLGYSLTAGYFLFWKRQV